LERVKNVLNDYAPNLTVQHAFLPLVRDRIFQTGRLDDLAHCLWVIDEMHRKGELPLRPEIEEARSDAWRKSLYVRKKAYDLMVAEEAHYSGVRANDAQGLLEIIQNLGQQHDWKLNEEGLRRQHQRQDIQCRERLIQTIAAGRSMYPVWRPEHGQFRYFPIADLENESDEVLKALAQRVPEWREQIGGHSLKGTKPQAEEGVTLSVPAQKHVGVANDEFLAYPTDPTREYTTQEIKRMSRDEYNRLVFAHGQSRGTARRNAITRILAGRKYGE
jgi:hypothetical protein